jgi:hypothetical protein
MEVVFAFCITGLFSVWVWNLKQEVHELRHEIADEAGPSPRAERVAVNNGVQTWSIEG